VLTPDVARELVADNPVGAAERMLAYILRKTRAVGGAVLACRGGHLATFVDRTTVDKLALADRERILHEDQLEAGDRITIEECAILPLHFEDRLVGLLLVDRAADGKVNIGDVEVPLAAAVAAPPPRGPSGTVVDYELSGEDYLKEKTLRLLTTHRWNIAAVAEAMHCTRRAIYMRLARWGIPRQKIVKTRRRKASSPAGA
jgi:transcriptional regulator with GAF, ATPase, and Fis domain